MLKYQVVHDIPGRMRIRYGRYLFSQDKALALRFALSKWDGVNKVEVNERTGSILFIYDVNQKAALLENIKQLDIRSFDIEPYKKTISDYHYLVVQRNVNDQYIQQFAKMLATRYASKLFLPFPIRNALTLYQAIQYLKEGLNSLRHKRVDVPVLDATSITVSLLSKQWNTARNIMFLLSISQLLEDYTKKKTTLQLKETLAVNVDKVWVLQDDVEKQIPTASLQKGDTVIVQMGSMVPVDGEVVLGEGMINEASFTGEPLSKMVKTGSSVFAGTVVEEGKIYVKVRNLQFESRINKIVDLIDTNESLKASIQSDAEHLADAIVPYSFIGFFGLLLLTRNLSRATSILLVDYSCAIKLSTSISVISAMQEASRHSIMVKGGKYMEMMAQADTIVFDKTGTLTNAEPFVKKVTPLQNYSREEILKIAACLEEHFPHSVANAIVKQAERENLHHEEEHAKVEYIIAHGIATIYHEQRAVIGSDHFIFEDEDIEKTQEIEQLIDQLQSEGASSLIYLAIGGQLAGIISIYDPLKKEAKQTIQDLRKSGFSHIVMLTGDCENAARFIADELDIDEYLSGVLPEDKAQFVKKLKEEGRTVVMVGDGVNDTPALSSADVSISLQDSSDIARELADVTLTSSDLEQIVVFKQISKLLMNRIHRNYTKIVALNSSLIVLGAIGLLPVSTTSFIHNASTFVFSIGSSTSLLKDEVLS
ncbi:MULTISPECIES: heavy metal translocating P-type ATPase [Coprobacillaceae]|uniref:heavy metal translocating P-type ATPase n=1 Tax=Coprobacillaceae TaxID=2810280 RepID=UPI000E4F4F8B|nr:MULTISPECIES: heavy metal translocating P-type ATPase [Coprobacillaceae]RHM61515.1 heavy metal translocating P-type ATPase [Coprobacillus sp. AF33-1AC]RHS93940.1 heavy metal translocating P-type ATPase [Erysipelatoclostridium sp. AM42-17]